MAGEHLFSTHFSHAAAQAWVPQLQRMFAELHEILARGSEATEELRRTVRRHGNGGGVDLPHWLSDDARLKAILATMQGAGIVLQDVQRGLVDFPHLHGGREILLCWELADGDELAHWHEVHAGFVGRQPWPPA